MTNQVSIPEGIKSHQKDYKTGAWLNYSFSELGNWVELLAKRSTHRTSKEKREKDLYDAQNYLDMMQEKLNTLK